jgi:hypothetical protein
MNNTTPNFIAFEDYLDGIRLTLEADFNDRGLLCDDGHWMTGEEFSQLSDEEVIWLFNLVYDKAESLDELKAKYGLKVL